MESQREHINCPEYGKDLARGSLAAHHQTQHGVTKGGLGQDGDRKDGVDEPIMYRMVFPEKAGPRPWPVER